MADDSCQQYRVSSIYRTAGSFVADWCRDALATLTARSNGQAARRERMAQGQAA